MGETDRCAEEIIRTDRNDAPEGGEDGYTSVSCVWYCPK